MPATALPRLLRVALKVLYFTLPVAPTILPSSVLVLLVLRGDPANTMMVPLVPVEMLLLSVMLPVALPAAKLLPAITLITLVSPVRVMLRLTVKLLSVDCTVTLPVPVMLVDELLIHVLRETLPERLSTSVALVVTLPVPKVPVVPPVPTYSVPASKTVVV